MTCEIDQGELTAYVDHQLTQDEWERVRVHVETCAHCHQIVTELQRTTEELEHYFQTVIAPLGFEDQVMQSLNSIRQTRQMSRLSAIYLISVGAGLGAVIAFLVSPLGSIMGVIFHTLFVLLHGLSLMPISLSYGWFVVFGLSSIGFAATSFFGLRWLLRTLNGEVII